MIFMPIDCGKLPFNELLEQIYLLLIKTFQVFVSNTNISI